MTAERFMQLRAVFYTEGNELRQSLVTRGAATAFRRRRATSSSAIASAPSGSSASRGAPAVGTRLSMKVLGAGEDPPQAARKTSHTAE